ncbi:cilia- and flagella-associated protein 46 [Pristis pectinata]|uniref:cilia- and flagella-associated protein 46 n=1 Tax=Pristis pectinata TaxID=685728 RepID=UPI00223E4412|nr:cilia- and flagella-associated protein 46 [Pristis pectinata]
MDMSIRHLLAEAAVCGSDLSTLKKAYNLIKEATAERTTLARVEILNPDLYVQCAELALQFKQEDISQDCLTMYFEGTRPYNQFLCRACLCQAQLYAPKSAANQNELNKAVRYIHEAIKHARKESRYYFLIYNASVIYWRIIRPFLKPGFYTHVISSLSEVIKSLQMTEDLDYEWLAQLMIALIECYLDEGKMQEATNFSNSTANFIKLNVPHMYPKIVSIQVFHNLEDFNKVSKELKGSVHLTAICKIQRLKFKIKERDISLNLTVQLNQIHQLIKSCETASTTSFGGLSDTHLPSSTAQLTEDERLSLLLELAHLALEVKHFDMASYSINDLKKHELKDKATAMEIECLESELEIQRLGKKAEKCTKSFVEHSLRVIKRIDQVLQNAIREGNGNLIQTVCVTQWNLCLPLLEPNLRKHVYKPLVNVATALNDLDSLLVQLRCQVHIEIAQIEEDENRIEVAMEQLKKAFQLNDRGPYKNYIKQTMHRLQLYSSVYEFPKLPEDQAILIIEQVKRYNDLKCGQNNRSLMIKAGEALAPISFQQVLDSENKAKVFVGRSNTGLIGLLAAKVENYMNCIQKTEGHLERLEDVNDKLRVGIWTDLVKVARKQEIWDVCRAACQFCLLYDDGRWKLEKSEEGDSSINITVSDAQLYSSHRISSSLHSSRKTFYSNVDVIRLLADIHFIKGEATIHLLRSEGAEFNNMAVFPGEKQTHSTGFVAKNLEESPEWITYRNWIDYLSYSATKSFLRAAELGVQLNEAIIVCNAAVYIWNYNHHLQVAGRYKELVKPFQTLLDALKKTGHCGETVILVMLCNGLCQGLIQPWIPSPTNIEKSESGKGSPPSAKKKPPAKKPEKPNVPQVLTVDPEGVPHLNEALQICEFALRITNGRVPSDVVPIAVRYQIIITWVKIKQLLQQQIGLNLGSDNEMTWSEKRPDVEEAQQSNDSQSSMVQVLIALEMYSCNSNRLMKFTVPSLLELENKISSCNWTDKLLELEVWTRLMQLAYVNNDNPLVMQCAQKAFELEKLVAQSPGFKKHEKHNYAVEHELLSVVACIQGQNLMKTGAGNSEMHFAAIKAFELSASHGEKAGCMKLVMNSAKHFWNSCLSLIPTIVGRSILEEPLKSFLNAIHNTYSKTKKEEEKEEMTQHPTVKHQTHYSILEQLAISVDDPEDDLKLRAAMYGLLFHINANKGDWKAGLKVLDNAIRDMPKTKQRLLLFKHRIMVNTRLGHNIQMDMQKLNDESEDHVSYMWHRVAVFSKDIANQLTCYQNSVGALKKPGSNWQKIEELIEFGEWLYCNGFPVTDALCQLDWAVDILLSMRLWVKPKEDEEEHLRKENMPKSENFIPIKHQLLIGAQSIDTNLILADLQDVRQLETLVIVHTIMATIAGHASSQQHCLMAYAYVMCIWQVSLTSAGVLIRELTAATPPKTTRADTETKSNKSKGKKESASDGREKFKSNLPPESVPANPEEWALYICPNEVRQAFKRGSSSSLINRKNILKPTYTLFYMDLLVKELQSLSYTHLTLPILQLEELIASEVLDNRSLSDLYHLRIAQICLKLNLTQAAQYHESIPGSVFIYDTERAKCRQEMIRLKDLQLGTSEDSMLTSNRNLPPPQTVSNSELNMHFTAPVVTRKKLSGVSVMDVWINKAEALLQLGFYQPARVLLSEVHKVAKELENKEALANVFYLLAVLANHERNFGQAKLLLKEAQDIGGNEYFWYDVITCLVNAILGENLEGSKEQACRILKQGIAAYKTALEETPNRASVLEFMITSTEARLTSIEIESVKAIGDINLKKPDIIEKLVSACAKMEQYSNIMMQRGYREESVEMMTECVGILIVIAKCSEEEEIKHAHLLDAYTLIQSTILIEEDALSDLMRLLPLKAMTGVSLPLMRKLASLKLIFVQLVLDMLELVTTKDKKEAETAKNKGLLQLIVEEFVSSTPEYTSIEKQWVTVSRSLGQKALSQLHSAHSLSSGSEELQAKCLYLTGRCLRLLAVQIDPINPGFVWVQDTLENKNGLSKEVKSREENEKVESNYEHTDLHLSTQDENEQVESEHVHSDMQLSAQQLAKCIAIAAQIKKERAIAQVYLAHASEVLLQSMNQALNSNLTNILAAASLDMVECFGQFDPVSASQYLALHQSCLASIMLKEALIRTGYDTSSSQLVALLHLQQKLEKDGTMKNMLKTVNERLSRNFKAWKNIIIQPQHLSFQSEFPSNFNIFVLQHSEDRSMLYGALLEKPKQKPIVEKKAKGRQSPGPTQAKIFRVPVNPQLFSILIAKISNYKNNLAQHLLKLEYQYNHMMQRKKVFQKLHEDINPEMKTKSTTEYEHKLDEDFSSIIDSMEEYLNPLLSQFDFTFTLPPTPLATGMDSGKSKHKKKEEKPVGGKSTPGQSQGLGEFVILLADKLLMELPLEALKVLQKDVISSVSRDFSLQLLYNRQHRDEPETPNTKDVKTARGAGSQKKNIKMVAIDRIVPPNCFPVDTHNFRYIVDPYDETNDLELFSPVKVMTEIIETYSSQFTGHWFGVMGSEHVPSHATWEELLKSCSAFVFYGKEHFLANLLPSKLVSMNFPECQLVILLDLVQTSQSFRRQSILDRAKSALQLSTEGQMNTAILLSLTGVRSVMLNQWQSTLQDNALKFKTLSKNLLELGKTTGQTIIEITKTGRRNVSKNDTEFSAEDPVITVNDGSLGSASEHPKDQARKDHPEEHMTQQSAFNFILYGLPNLIVT